MPDILGRNGMTPAANGRLAQGHSHELAALVRVFYQAATATMAVVAMVASMRRYLKGGGDIDLIVITAIVSCSIFLSPWFALGLPAVVLLRPHTQPMARHKQVITRPPATVVLQLKPPEKAPPSPQPLPRARNG